MNPLTVQQITGGNRTNRVPISFARFMELALYAPGLGYYERQQAIGRRGDFFTSVSVGELFGELLAFKFSEWLEELRIADCGLRIIEVGAHDGRLAKDILNWLREFRTDLFEQIEYCFIEPSAQRQNWQEENLREFAARLRWFPNILQSIAPTNPQWNQIIFSNELLDAMPVHRLCWNADKQNWRET